MYYLTEFCFYGQIHHHILFLLKYGGGSSISLLQSSVVQYFSLKPGYLHQEAKFEQTSKPTQESLKDKKRKCENIKVYEGGYPWGANNFEKASQVSKTVANILLKLNYEAPSNV